MLWEKKIMKKIILASLLSLLMITSVFAVDYTVELVDSYGDGWNGGALTISVNGTIVLENLTLATGTGPESHSFAVEPEDLIEADYTSGSYGYENEYQILDNAGVVVAQSGQDGVEPGDVSYTLPAADALGMAILISPANMAGNVALDASLEWTAGENSDSSVLYFAENAELTDAIIVNPATSPYYPTLVMETTYYWKVVAVNGAEQVESSVRSFTTVFPTITTFPWTEDFSDDDLNWTILDANDDGDMWETDYTTNPQSAPQVAIIYTDYNEGSNDDYLVTPQLALTGAERLRYSYRVQSSGEPNDFEVLLSTTGIAPADFTNVLLESADYSNTTYLDETIDLTAYSGNCYIAFHVPADGLDGWRLYIDDVIVEEAPTGTLIQITPDVMDFGDVNLGYSATQTFTIANNGVIDASIAEITVPTGFSVVTPDPIPSPLGVGESFTVDVTFTPIVALQYSGNLRVKEAIGFGINHDVALTGAGIPVPQGATCADPIALTFPTGTITNDTETFIDNYSSTWITPSSTYLNGNDVVYQFTLANSRLLNGTISSNGYYLGAFILQAEPNEATPANVILAKTSYSDDLTYTNYMLPAGTYYLIISSSTSTQSLDYTIDLTADALPVPGLATNPSPAHEAIDRPTALTLSWSNAAYTETIDLWFGIEGARDMALVLDNVDAVEEYEVTGLVPGATYNWKVVNRNYSYVSEDPLVATWSFTTISVAPGVATYTSPSNAGTNIAKNGNLAWNSVTGANGYYVYFSTDETFADVVEPVDQTGNTYAYTGDFDTTYYWKVIPYNAVGPNEAAAAVWSFTTLPSPFPEADLVFDGVRSESKGMPMEPYFGYTITQNIYNQEELNIEDSAINSISYLYNENSAWSETIEIYMGHTDKDVFDTTTDWINSGLTHVFSGTMAVTNTESIVTLDLTTPFVYNNTDNLVVVFFATETGYHSSSDEFFNYPVDGYKSLQYQSDTINPYATWPTPPATGNLKAYRPVTGFNYQTLQQEATFVVSADTLTYPETEMGLTSLAQNLSVSNLGLADLGITGIAVAGTNADQFVLTDTNVYPVALGTGGNMSVSVVYAPTTEGEHTAELQITDNQNRVVNTVQLVASSIDNNIYAVDLPWNDSFEGDLAGWRYMMQSTSTSSGVFIGEETDAQDGVQSIQLYAGYDANAVISFISPTFIDGLTNTRLTYWVKGSSGSTLTIGTYNQAIDTFTSIETIDVPTTYTEFDLSFLPVRTGERIAFVSDFSSTYQNIYLDNLQVEEISQNSVAELSVEALDFVDTIVNEESDSLTVTVKNLGMAPLTITDVVLSGVNPNDFSFTYDTEAMTIAYDETFDIYVKFNPLMEGERAATLEISNNISRAVDNVALTGTAVDPAIYEIEIPYTLDFETEAQLLGWSADITSTGLATATRYSSSFNAHAGTYSYRLYHPTTDSTNVKLISPLVVPDMNLYRIRFWAKKSNTSNTDPIVIGKYNADMTTFTAIQSLDLTSTYTEYTVEMIEPERANERIVFNFASNQAYQNIYIDDVRFEPIPLVPIAELSVTEINFGSILVSETSSVETVTISNVGPDILTISTVAIDGTDAAMFSWDYSVAEPDMQLANGESLEIDVTFTPTSAGDKVATLVINDDLGSRIRINSASKSLNNTRNANNVALMGKGLIGDSHNDPIILTLAETIVENGTTTPYNSTYTYCSSQSVVYKLTLLSSQVMDISLVGSSFDTKLWVFNSFETINSGTDADRWFYNDDSPGGTGGTSGSRIAKEAKGNTRATWSSMSPSYAPAGEYYIVIAGYSTNNGAYTLTVNTADLPIPAAATSPSPATAATDQPTALTLGWTNAPYTERVDVWFGVEGARDMALVLDDVAAVNSYEVTGLLTNTTYNWKIVNRNYSGETLPANVVTWSFTTVGNAPAAVAYTAPDDASTGRPLSGSLSWSAAVGAEGYRVYLSTDNTFDGVTPVEQATRTYAYSALEYSTTYYWKVLPYNIVGEPTEGVLVWSFTTIADPTLSLPVTIDFTGSTTVPAAYITDTNMYITGSGHGNTQNVLYKNIYTSTTSAYVQFQAVTDIEATSVIEFDYRFIQYSGYTATTFIADWDYLIVKASTDGGENFTVVDQINDDNHVNSGDFANYSVNIGNFVGQTVIFRFEMNDDDVNDYYFDIDNIHFGEHVVSSLDVPTITMNNENGLEISWLAVTDANSYQIWACDTPDGTYTELDTTDALSYVHTTDDNMKFFKVRAIYTPEVPSKGFRRRGRN